MINQINKNIYNKNPLIDWFDIKSEYSNNGIVEKSYCEEIQNFILEKCDTIITIKDGRSNQVYDFLVRESSEITNLITDYLKNDLFKEYHIYLTNNKLKYIPLENIFFLRTNLKENLENLIKYNTDLIENSVIYTTTKYSNEFLINQYFCRELKLN